MTYDVKVYVTLKEGVLDPQGSAVKNSLHHLGFDGVSDVRIGKVMTLRLEATEDTLHDHVKQMCDKLLANPVIEDYTYEAEEVVSS
ncbi:phosphoribosylformylglycinamidine synthase subunit PurS [Salipaludibacillus agaradhaerens]|jgi:phosphoribosylformylglycinamidine synthase|uniref:phosphoribosylformylglycinamidine synthase subunit PurS n=1 Tax=Salipaludibacillus TaxID=1884449 RepID=UPI0020D1576F|nr:MULTISPECIES: phosphoribosylformylglycinamidine synthase subunit PurS [Salipaludibacillus]MCR6105556.1 phosphoribosylformylglycinamidine synthase subunit PurS [Salipaludibacillus agaradhaerens]MCR6117593.1 phosphoribosylformylglycinamidine synthase subunit PurS [Salipaludibacillus agaradhaerens]UTR13675.1 phosphoribosylformylglycinamidine synthase subunit PurS [Salipaludibacillus sp. LMS25]